jgi:triacylglycerol esterase/lipase EstA (alpha/beta hydrolase family)
MADTSETSHRLFLFAAVLALAFLFVRVAHASVYVPNVQALYHFDASDLTDSSGNGYNGTNNGVTFNTTSSKLGGGAVSFNTTNDFQAPSSTFAWGNANFTVGFWVYGRSNFTAPVFLSQDTGSGAQPKGWLSDNVACVNGLEAAEQNPSHCFLGSTGNHIATGAWHWLVYEKQGTRWELYVDDVLKDTETTANASAINQPTQFNGVSEGSGAPYNYATWDMDEYFFSTSYISTSTRDLLYASGSGTEACSTAGCDGGPAIVSIASGTLEQYKSDASSTIGAGGSTTETTVVFGGNLQSTGTSTLRLEVEVEPATTTFTGVATVSSTLVTPGSSTTATITGLALGAYHWQARAVDQYDASSSWQLFGANATGTDFIVATSTLGSYVYVPNVVALYRFEGNAANSISSSSYAGNPNGGTVSYGTSHGKFGEGALLDSDGAIELTTSTTSDFDWNNYSISFWVNPTSSLTGGAIFIGRDIGPGSNPKQFLSYSILCTANHLEFYDHSSGCIYDKAGMLSTHTWHNIVLTHNSSSSEYIIYLDGTSLGTVSAAGSLANIGANTWIGQSGENSGYPNGTSFDDVAFIKGVLAPTDVDNIWNGGAGRQICVTVGCGTASTPSLSSLHQYKSDATSTLNEGSSTPEFTVFFGANASSSVTSTLQIEVKPAGTAFTGTPTVTSTPVAAGSGTVAIAHISDVDGAYHWQARVIDINNNSSSWQIFGANTSSTDFVIDRNPVVIIPGITGTALDRASDSVEVWPDVLDMIASPSDGYLDDLKLTTSTAQTVAMEPGDIIREEGSGDVEEKFYGNLIDLLSALGYEEGSKLFVAPYDWRFSVASSADEIAPVIQNAVNHSSDGKIDIIAHSMGGLVAKEYLNATSTSFMNKLILAGVPQIGAPRVFNILNYGDDLDLKWYDYFGLNPDKVKEISQNMPGVYDLLPSRPYIDLTGGYVSSSAGLLDYDDTNTFMTSSTDPRNSTLLSRSDSLHQFIDDKQFSIASSSVYNIIGCNRPTIGQFNVNPGEVDITAVSGDKDVPLTSANYLSAGYNNYFIAPASSSDADDHLGLVRDDESLKLIWDVLDNELSELPQYVATASSSCFDINPFLVISTHSPVELNVYDSQGRHVGPNHVQHRIDSEIPGSSYDVITHNDFAIVPAGENYRVVVNSVGTGTFNLDIEKYDSKFHQESKAVYLSIPVLNTSTTAEADITPTDITPTLNVNMGSDVSAITSYEATTVTNFEGVSSSSAPATESTSSLDQIPTYEPTPSDAATEPASTTDFSLPGQESSSLDSLLMTSTPIFATSSMGDPSSSLLQDTSTIIEATSSDLLPDAATSSIDSTTTQESVSWWQKIVAALFS